MYDRLLRLLWFGWLHHKASRSAQLHSQALLLDKVAMTLQPGDELDEHFTGLAVRPQHGLSCPTGALQRSCSVQ